MTKGQIGFDLDSSLAFYDHWRGATHIGEPIKPAVDLAKKYMDEGWEVIIFTARVAPEEGIDLIAQRKAIQEWTKRVFGKSLKVTCIKGREIVHYFDDRATGLQPNTGKLLSNPEIQPHPFPNGMPNG